MKRRACESSNCRTQIALESSLKYTCLSIAFTISLEQFSPPFRRASELRPCGEWASGVWVDLLHGGSRLRAGCLKRRRGPVATECIPNGIPDSDGVSWKLFAPSRPPASRHSPVAASSSTDIPMGALPTPPPPEATLRADPEEPASRCDLKSGRITR